MTEVEITDVDTDLITAGVPIPDVDMLSEVAELQCLLSYGVTALDLNAPDQQATVDLRRIDASLRYFLQTAAQNGNPQPGYEIG